MTPIFSFFGFFKLFLLNFATGFQAFYIPKFFVFMENMYHD